jgi:hypothetical protein
MLFSWRDLGRRQIKETYKGSLQFYWLTSVSYPGDSSSVKSAELTREIKKESSDGTRYGFSAPNSMNQKLVLCQFFHTSLHLMYIYLYAVSDVNRISISTIISSIFNWINWQIMYLKWWRGCERNWPISVQVLLLTDIVIMLFSLHQSHKLVSTVRHMF